MKLTHHFLLLPKTSIEVYELLREAGRSHDEALKTIKVTGITNIRSAHPTLLTSFVFDGLTRLQEMYDDILIGVDSIIVVSQSYDQRIPTISTRIQSRFNLSSATFCIDLIDGCSGYIKALKLVSLLTQSGFKKALIVAGDLNSCMTRQADIGTKILFGDGLSVSILESDNSALLDTRLFNNGDHQSVIACSFSDAILGMNGFEVFRFTKQVVPQMIKSYLNETNKSLADYPLMGLHQASELVVSTICASLNHTNPFCADFLCGEIGNLGAGSIGAWLSNIHDLDKKGPLQMLAVGFGAGLSWGLASLLIDMKKNEVIDV